MLNAGRPKWAIWKAASRRWWSFDGARSTNSDRFNICNRRIRKIRINFIWFGCISIGRSIPILFLFFICVAILIPKQSLQSVANQNIIIAFWFFGFVQWFFQRFIIIAIEVGRVWFSRCSCCRLIIINRRRYCGYCSWSNCCIIFLIKIIGWSVATL